MNGIFSESLVNELQKELSIAYPSISVEEAENKIVKDFGTPGGEMEFPTNYSSLN